MSIEKFKKLSKTLSDQGYGNHIILIRDGDTLMAYTDDQYVRQSDLRNIFLNLANVSGRVIDEGSDTE